MNELLLELIRPSATVIRADTVERITRQTDWRAFCSLAYRTGFAPLAYERLRRHPALVPRDVLEWLRSQYYQTTCRNLIQLNTLQEVTTKLSTGGIPVLVLKGLVLAYFGLGLRVRSFSDLDLLVQRQNLQAVRQILRSLGYLEVPGPPHAFHQRYLRVHPGPPAGIEVHFDLIERGGSSFCPDLASIWAGSTEVRLLGHIVRAPELSDHLLLVMMQLPHHDWALRLLADVAHVVFRWGGVIDWKSLVERAESWRMRFLVGSTLYVSTALLNVALPPHVGSLFRPESYFRRVQWHIAKEVAMQHLAYKPRPEIFRIAAIFMTDRPKEVGRLWQQALRSIGNRRTDPILVRTVQRLLVGVLSLPALFAILFRGLFSRSLRI